MQKLTCKISRTTSNPYWRNGHFGTRHFAFTLSNGKSKFSSFYSQGAALRGDPTGEDILHGLLMDRSAFNGSSDFEDFCRSFCYDENSREAKVIFNGCKKTARALERMIDDIDEVEEICFEKEADGLREVICIDTQKNF